jgi:GEVED domain
LLGSKHFKSFLLIKNILFSVITLAITGLGVNLYKKNVLFREADYGDAPVTYGLAKHYNPNAGPYFGQNRGDDDSKVLNLDSLIFATTDNGDGKNDEDAFLYNGNNTSINSNSLPLFIPEIRAEEPVYTLKIPIKDAEPGDPVRGWIDFNGNAKFDEDEKAATQYKDGAFVILTWRLPVQLNTALTYLRLRTCKQIYVEEIEFPNGAATSGEVEDYVVRIIKSIIPSPELKEYIDFTPFDEASGLKTVAPIIGNLKIGDKKIHIKVLNNPEIIGINSRHDAGITGLRIGHEDTTVRNKKNPIIVTLNADELLENVNFQLIDIDGGDRIKIEGYNKGMPVPFSINNLTDNYFYQFNTELNEIYSDASTDAGTDSLIPSSLDMAININFKDFIDSIKLTYTDDALESSGSFTIGNFSTRKYNFPPVNIQNFSAAEKEDSINLNWILKNAFHISSYLIERSYDGILYETVGSKQLKNSPDTSFSFTDNTLPPVMQYCYYRIKIVEIDNHYSYSPVLRFRKKGSISLSGFKTSNPSFTSTVDLMLLTDMPGKITVTMHDYAGKKTGLWLFENKLKNDILMIGNFDKLPDDIYYIEISNQDKKYLIEVYKNVTVTPSLILTPAASPI